MTSPVPPDQPHRGPTTIKRRRLLLSLATLPVIPVLTHAGGQSKGAGRDLENPYEAVDWDRWTCLHSMSHQHQGQTDASRDLFHAMGYRHFAFSNYYPSAPTYPLPHAYLAAHPELIGAPNAEHHSFTDAPLHANALGSLLATGYGSSLSAEERKAAPILHHFEDLHVFDTSRPWLGVYRLDVRLAAKAGGAKVECKGVLTIEGATECVLSENFTGRGPVHDRELAPGEHSLYFRTTSPSVAVNLAYDNTQLTVTQLRLMQGTNRPWRDVFRAALDGELVDGRRQGGLQYPDGGGVTLNHPTGKVEDYAAMLDFDPRVLGIEIWNQLTSGFGSSRGFYDQGHEPRLHFYQLWDELLRTGRRCWGFFVKDHNTYGRGRNVLMVPAEPDAPPSQREATALRAYRAGTFFGSVASVAVDDAGGAVAPFDLSGFRFNRINVQRDAQGAPEKIEVSVGGNDPAKRPNIQVRFVTDQGVASVVDSPDAEFRLERDESGNLKPLFVRVEAFAYPSSHLMGEPLIAEKMRLLNVEEISLIHDIKAPRGPTFFGSPNELRTPIPIVDMIFSQPLRRV